MKKIDETPRLRQSGFLPRYVPCVPEPWFVRSTGGNFLLPVSVDRQAIPGIADPAGGCRGTKSISSTIAKTTGIAGHNSERHLSTSSTAAAPTATTVPIGISRYLSLKCRSKLASHLSARKPLRSRLSLWSVMCDRPSAFAVERILKPLGSGMDRACRIDRAPGFIASVVPPPSLERVWAAQLRKPAIR